MKPLSIHQVSTEMSQWYSTKRNLGPHSNKEEALGRWRGDLKSNNQRFPQFYVAFWLLIHLGSNSDGGFRRTRSIVWKFDLKKKMPVFIGILTTSTILLKKKRQLIFILKASRAYPPPPERSLHCKQGFLAEVSTFGSLLSTSGLIFVSWYVCMVDSFLFSCQ